MLRNIVGFAFAVLLAPAGAIASPPHPANSEIPCGINLVGTTGGQADALGEFQIVTRNIGGDKVPGASIVIDFRACAPDIRICAVQPHPGVQAWCVDRMVQAVTDASGSVKLRIVGSATNKGSGSPAASYGCATIYGDGVDLGTVNVGAFDQNGAGGLNPADVAVWLADAFDDDYEGRSDFDCSKSVNPADLAMLTGATFGGGSRTSCASYCH